MDFRQLILRRKRYFDEEIKHYMGPDPLKLHHDFFSGLDSIPDGENSSKEVYVPLLQQTLKEFISQPQYKQDSRYINLWLKYSVTQPNPADVFKYMHSLGLGTESTVLYSSWAEQLIKSGSLSNADNVFKLGLNENLRAKEELQKQYDDFLKDVGRMLLSGKIKCHQCGTIQAPTAVDNQPLITAEEEVQNWEWNPLKVGEKDDFECPIAYFEDENSNQIRMYPKNKVYPSKNQEFSLEEIMAMEYEKKYKEEEERDFALAQAKANEELKEAQKTKTPVQASIPIGRKSVASIPVVTPNMFNLPKENSLVNQTTFTVHTKEAMNVVQDMWSSPAPSDKHGPSSFMPTINNLVGGNHLAPTPHNPNKFTIYTEDENTPAPPVSVQKVPFQIYDENVNAGSNKTAPRSSVKLRPLETNDPENIPPGQEVILTSKQAFKGPIEIYQDNPMVEVDQDAHRPKSRVQLFKGNEPDELAMKLESQAKLTEPAFNVPSNVDYSDVTCNTKAFEFSLPYSKTSTPLLNRHQKPHNNANAEKTGKIMEPSNLSVILEQSKDKTAESSHGSLASQTKIARSGALVEKVTEAFDPFCNQVLDDILKKIGFPKPQHLNNYFELPSNLPTGTKTMKLGEESFSLMGEIGKGAYAKVLKATRANGDVVALKIEKPACRWEYYIAKELQLRMPTKFASLFMDITSAYIYNNGSVLVTPYAKYGTLISVMNMFKEKAGNKVLDLGVILLFSLQLVDIVEHLHKAKIIHADLKPDNVVLRAVPAHLEEQPCLQLIDFGRCIDMSLFPADSQFHVLFKNEENMCIEMKENRPWSYQIDLQGLASIFHVLLYAEYMKLHKRSNLWCPDKPIPRHLRRDLWNPIFESLLNVNPSTDLPYNFNKLRAALQEAFDVSLGTFLMQIKNFGNFFSHKS